MKITLSVLKVIEQLSINVNVKILQMFPELLSH